MGYGKSKKPVVTGSSNGEIIASLVAAMQQLGYIRVETPLDRALREAFYELRCPGDYEDTVRVIQIVRAFLDNLAREAVEEIPDLNTSMFGKLSQLLTQRPYCEGTWAPSDDDADEEPV